jgi:hypothetical protein
MRLYLDFLVNRDPNLPLQDVRKRQPQRAQAELALHRSPADGADMWDDTLAMFAQARVLDVEVPGHRRLDLSGSSRKPRFRAEVCFAWWHKSAQHGRRHRQHGYLAQPAPRGQQGHGGGDLMPACELGSKQHSTPFSAA